MRSPFRDGVNTGLVCLLSPLEGPYLFQGPQSTHSLKCLPRKWSQEHGPSDRLCRAKPQCHSPSVNVQLKKKIIICSVSWLILIFGN